MREPPPSFVPAKDAPKLPALRITHQLVLSPEPAAHLAQIESLRTQARKALESAKTRGREDGARETILKLAGGIEEALSEIKRSLKAQIQNISELAYSLAEDVLEHHLERDPALLSRLAAKVHQRFVITSEATLFAGTSAFKLLKKDPKWAADQAPAKLHLDKDSAPWSLRFSLQGVEVDAGLEAQLSRLLDK